MDTDLDHNRKFIIPSIGHYGSHTADFMQIGRMVESLGITHLDVLEGGYSDQLPELIYQYLRGVMGKE